MIGSRRVMEYHRCMRATVADDPDRTCEERGAAFRAVLTSDVMERALRAIERKMGGLNAAVGGMSAADLLQDAIEASLTGRRSWDPDVEPWLHLRNMALDRLRRPRSLSARHISIDPLLDDEDDEEDSTGTPVADLRLTVGSDIETHLSTREARDALTTVAGRDPELAGVVTAIRKGAASDRALALQLGTSPGKARKSRARLIRLARRHLRRLAS